jgi:SET domain-containing protein
LPLTLIIPLRKNERQEIEEMTSKNGNNSFPIEVRRSRIQGRGVFATRRIRKGQRIIEYTGERITDEQADQRYNDAAMKRHHTFLFKVEDNLVVDADRGGNAARFINHSCDPNCEAVIEGEQIYIEAIRNIQPGVELAYDYQFDADEPLAEAIKQYPCRCGAKNCRGTIVKPKRRRRAGRNGKPGR